eukprot:SAG22_NODE_1851_length_3443_cov_4.745215_2_plen_88_part_00
MMCLARRSAVKLAPRVVGEVQNSVQPTNSQLTKPASPSSTRYSSLLTQPSTQLAQPATAAAAGGAAISLLDHPPQAAVSACAPDPPD